MGAGVGGCWLSLQLMRANSESGPHPLSHISRRQPETPLSISLQLRSRPFVKFQLESAEISPNYLTHRETQSAVENFSIFIFGLIAPSNKKSARSLPPKLNCSLGNFFFFFFLELKNICCFFRSHDLFYPFAGTFEPV